MTVRLSRTSHRFVPGAALAFVLPLAFGLAAATAHAADPVTLKSAWMRPAPAGKIPARVYVDIESTVDGKLVAAKTPIAKRVDLVRVKTLGDPASEVVVKSFPIAAGKTTRLAYYGDHLRLSGITRDAGNGDPVPLTLTFVDATGRRFTATTDVVVRGLLLPRQVPDAAAPQADPGPGAGGSRWNRGCRTRRRPLRWRAGRRRGCRPTGRRGRGQAGGGTRSPSTSTTS